MAWQSTLEEERRKLEELAEESIAWWRERLETSFLRLERLNDEPSPRQNFQLEWRQKAVEVLNVDVERQPVASPFEGFESAETSALSSAPSDCSTPVQAPPEATASTPRFVPPKMLERDLENLKTGTPTVKDGLTSSRSHSRTEMIDERRQRLSAIVNYTAGFLVLLNSMLMLVELEIEGSAIGMQLGVVSRAPDLSTVGPIFSALDATFVFVFLIELIARVFLDRWHVLRDVAFWFDAFLVTAGLVDMYLIMPLIDTGLGGEHKNIVLLRLVRAMKAFRAMRMVRTLRLFKGLRLLVKACTCFLPSLGWAMVLLGVFMSMGALILATLLQDYVLDESVAQVDREWIWSHYGTAYNALYTLFEITFAGNWPVNVRPVLEKVSQWYVIFFVLYVTIIVFAVIRVISAIFLKDTLEAANNDAENLVIERLQSKKQYVHKLEAVFKAIDTTGDGMITEERLAEMLSNPVVHTYFQSLDVDVHESRALFHLMDNGDGEVTLEEFVQGIMRCKGHARALDQVAMINQIKVLDQKVSKVIRALKNSDVIKFAPKSPGRATRRSS